MPVREFWKSRLAQKGPRFESHLREMREAAWVRVNELANFCQVSAETIQLIEEAKYEPSVVLAEHIARRIHTTVETLFTAHAPAPLRMATLEERINTQMWKVGYEIFFGIFACSVFGAAILLNFTPEEHAAHTLFAVAMVAAAAYVFGISRIRGYSRTSMLANTTKRNRLLIVIIASVAYATFMVLPVNKDETIGWRIGSFLFYAIFWGATMYWFNYRKSRRTPS